MQASFAATRMIDYKTMKVNIELILGNCATSLSAADMADVNANLPALRTATLDQGELLGKDFQLMTCSAAGTDVDFLGLSRS